MSITLTIPQTIAIDYLEDKVTREVLFGGAAGPGKTTLGCLWQLQRRLMYPGTRGLIGRTTLKTLKETTLVSFHKVCKMQGLQLGRDYFMNGNNNVMTFNNGSEILWKQLFYKPSDPDVDELGSLEITDYYVDESSQLVARVKEVLKSRVRYMLDEYDLIPKGLYSTNPAKNWNKTEFYDLAIAGKLPKTKQYVPALLDSNPFISKFYAENLDTLPKELKLRLRYGNWDYSDDPAQLMLSQNIANIFLNTFVQPGEKKYITADIARMGADRTVIRIWAGWRVMQRIEWTKKSIVESAAKIKQYADLYQIPMSQVMCDEDGIGGGVVDILKCKGFIANAKPDDGYKNKNNFNFATAKDQCGWYLADRINRNEVYEACADSELVRTISEELEHIKDAGLNKDSKNKLISKEVISAEIGRSPDDSDTYLMRAWFDLMPKTGGKFFKSNR